MRLTPLAPKFHIANRKRLAKSIGDDAIAVIDTADLLTRAGDFEYPFRPDSNFYYLTGISEPEAVLVLIPGHASARMRELLFVSGTSEFVGTWEGARLTPEAATKLSGIKTVLPLQDLEPILDRLVAKYQVVYTNAADSLTSVMTSPTLRRTAYFRDKLPTRQLRSAVPQISNQRQIKDPLEIERIRDAIAVTKSGLLKTFTALRPGLHEYELDAELSGEFIRLGSGHSFMPIVASGANSTIMHYMKNDNVVGDNDLVLFDVGAEVGWYAADISRTVPASGRYSDRQRALYVAVLRAQKLGISLHKPGASVLSIDEEMRKVLTEELAKLGVITTAQHTSKDSEKYLRKHYAHISHQLGLDLHDNSDVRAEFKPGMVVTCEPGLYLQKEGLGVRIEDDILITETGCEVLSIGIPSDPDEIEKIIQVGE